MKIMVVCGHGLGTSLMMEMSLKVIVNELNVQADIDHTDLGSAKGTECDLFVATNDIAEQLKALDVGQPIVALDNMVDKNMMKERLSSALKDMGVL
ncbi:PTS sugar transporter subunit IIB [Grimontia hollisae]|uniref:Ascorbate-specific phosphotransferase enzyme IIB component n=1 Tax=Grimontia hollisae TaxID=673 RepID=A0A377HIF0_GRIHO|nr:PTS sugar transporter subunit IIB [Grimontia hollisae]STO56018.1 Ascorbate-specific phosphotransferase enzyme IIB component [Grimontia hollisae]